MRGGYGESNGSAGEAKKADCWILMLLKQLTRQLGDVTGWDQVGEGGCSQFGRDSVSRLLSLRRPVVGCIRDVVDDVGGC